MLHQWIWKRLVPYMTLKRPNKKYSVFAIRHFAGKELGRYVSQEEMQTALKDFGFPVSKYYPVSDRFFKEVGCNEYKKSARYGCRG